MMAIKIFISEIIVTSQHYIDILSFEMKIPSQQTLYRYFIQKGSVHLQNFAFRAFLSIFLEAIFIKKKDQTKSMVLKVWNQYTSKNKKNNIKPYYSLPSRILLFLIQIIRRLIYI